jgi:hypothetical protein
MTPEYDRFATAAEEAVAEQERRVAAEQGQARRLLEAGEVTCGLVRVTCGLVRGT